MVNSNKGEAATLILLVVVLLGGGAWGLSKTKWFSSESKRAATSTQTTADLLAAKDAQSAKAGAVFTSMGGVIQTLPDTREKDFLNRSVGIGLSFTSQPDPAFLLEMEKLKVAVLSGQLKQANEINASLSLTAAQDRARAERAIVAKTKSDLALEQAAAENLGAEKTQFYLFLLLGAGAILYIYTKLSHVSPGALASAVADIRSGTSESDLAIRALDSVTTPTQQLMTRGNVWLKTKFNKLLT